MSLQNRLEEGDDKLLLVALRQVVKSRGFAKVAQGAGLRRETRLC